MVHGEWLGTGGILWGCWAGEARPTPPFSSSPRRFPWRQYHGIIIKTFTLVRADNNSSALEITRRWLRRLREFGR